MINTIHVILLTLVRQQPNLLSLKHANCPSSLFPDWVENKQYVNCLCSDVTSTIHQDGFYSGELSKQ